MAYRDDLSAAVARAEAAERVLAGVCFLHTQLPSTGECAACKRRFCDACLTASDAGMQCTTCFVAHTSRRRRKQLMAVAAGVVLAAGGVVGFAALGSRKDDRLQQALTLTPAPSSENPKYTTRPNRIRLLREALAADACNRDAALELAELLNENLAYHETSGANSAFLTRCGAFPRLVWTSIYASEQLGQWGSAAALATELIQDQPTDPDFWWWRGQDRAQLGLLEEAAADYRQSMAFGATRFAPHRFAAVAEKLHRPCEAAFAIRDAAIDRGGELGGSWERFKQLYSAGACDDLTGHGKAVIKFKPELPFITAKVTFEGGQTGTFVVDRSAGQLTLTRELAARLGLAGKTKITTYVMGELREGQSALVDKVAIEGATATAVDAVIIDSLAPGLDGVAGLSLLWRFRVDRDDEKGELTLTGWGP